jgi:hypothetical protein
MKAWKGIVTLLFAIMLITGFLVEWPPADESVFPATINTTYAELGTYTLGADDGDGNTDDVTVEIGAPAPTPTSTPPLRRGGGGGGASASYVVGASANDVDEGSEAPEHPAPPEPQSPTWETTIDNLDGTFTFQQQVDEASTAPHYVTPSSGGFEEYSWYDEDYGWKHTFPDYNQPNLQITSATLTVHAWDVDSETFYGYGGEYDGVTGDGNWLDPQYLQGTSDTWSTTTFNVNPGSLSDGELNIWLDIDMHHSSRFWATTLDYSQLTIEYTYIDNDPPYAPTLSISPVGCTYTTDDLVVTVIGPTPPVIGPMPPVTGPTPPDPDGDTVTYEYRWFVDTGTGFFVDDEFAGRGDHTGNTVPAADTQDGDKWRVQVTPVDEHGAHGSSNTVTFTTIGQCNTPPIADAGGDKTSTTTSVTLDGSGSDDPDGTIVSYLWELYSGGTWTTIGTSESITYNFGGLGTYQVRLTVTDNDGLTDTDNAYITIASGGVGPTVESANNAGTPQDIFQPADPIYAIGSGYTPSTTYDLYVVLDTTWTDGMVIPARVTGTETSVTTDGSGNIAAGILIWSSSVAGQYDMVVDVNGNGNYDAGTDALDSNMSVGFEEIPEFSTIALPVASILGLLFFFNHRKRRKEE